jgi:hypothetical protein
MPIIGTHRMDLSDHDEMVAGPMLSDDAAI